MTDLTLFDQARAMRKWATLSPDELYRWTLGRRWGPGGGRRLLWCMLNPSTADANVDDLTITKVIEFTRRAGYGEFVAVNLFAYRATKPEDVVAAHAAGVNVAGPGNTGIICDELTKADALVVAWGATVTKITTPPRRAPGVSRFNVVDAARRHGKPVLCLGVTAGGHPRHPSRLGYAAELRPYTEPA